MTEHEGCKMLPECARELGAIGTNLTNINAKLDKLNSALFGNGTPGLIMQVDRLQQTHARNVWWLRTLAVVVLGLVGKLVYGWVTGK